MHSNELQGKLDLLSRLLDARPTADDALNKFTQITDRDYIGYIKVDDALAEKAEALLELHDIQNSLETFICNKEIYSKNAIVLAGRFSSGKTAFCNSIFSTKEILLPESVEPETSIPTYVINGEKSPNVFGMNSAGNAVEIGIDSYKQISNDLLNSPSFKLKKLMPAVVIHAPLPHEFKHICFIDTPGYSSFTAKDLFANRNYETALKPIQQAKALFWFIGMDENGALIKSDLDFLQETLKEAPDKKVVVICNKADLISQEDREEALDYFANILNNNNIPYDGISAYSSIQRKEYGYRKNSLQKIISELNYQNTDKKKELQKRLKALFNKHVNADANRIQSTAEKIKTLNQILSHFNSLINSLESKFSIEAAIERLEAIRHGDGSESKDELEAESIAFVTKNISKLKADLEKDIEKYKKNKDTISKIASKMDEIVKEIFQGFEESVDDAYVSIPAGTFTMGSDEGPRDSKPAHSVTLDSFMMKITPVTQAEWKSVMGDTNPSNFKGDLLPVHNVSIASAMEYCNKISIAAGLNPCYSPEGVCDYSANGYRLPTEAEWEYAASSFAEKPLQNCAWFTRNSSGTIQPVAQKEENDFGLYDMLGNVYEWTNDYWNNYSTKSQINPHGPSNGEERVIRGGSFKSSESNCAVFARNLTDDDNVTLPIGFRVVKKG